MMITSATNQEVVDFARTLIVSLGGAKKSISGTALSQLHNSYTASNLSQCIGEIKKLCGLGLTLRVCYLKNHPSNESVQRLARNSLRQIGIQAISNEAFAGHDFRDSVAFIVSPGYFPIYGTSDFNKLKIPLFIFMKSTGISMETFVYAVAHELSHIILYALNHPLRNNEVAVDLTAMILGFHDIIRIGRKVGNETYGYFSSDNQFELAYNEVRKLTQIIYL